MTKDVFSTVLAYKGEAPPLYKGKAYLYPFAQGGAYWRESDVSKLADQAASEGPIHYAGIRYIEDGDGKPKAGRREIRGLLVVREDADGRVFLRRDESEWEVVTAPECGCGWRRIPGRPCESCKKP